MINIAERRIGDPRDVEGRSNRLPTWQKKHLQVAVLHTIMNGLEGKEAREGTLAHSTGVDSINRARLVADELGMNFDEALKFAEKLLVVEREKRG